VLPILTNHCFTCHSNANAPDFTFGFSLEDHEDVSAASTLIVGAINHNEGFVPMPQGSDQLDSCQIETIEAWVNQGSLNN
jgi:mono/diheme cytochrome c family protein